MTVDNFFHIRSFSELYFRSEAQSRIVANRRLGCVLQDSLFSLTALTSWTRKEAEKKEKAEISRLYRYRWQIAINVVYMC